VSPRSNENKVLYKCGKYSCITIDEEVDLSDGSSVAVLELKVAGSS